MIHSTTRLSPPLLRRVGLAWAVGALAALFLVPPGPSRAPAQQPAKPPPKGPAQGLVFPVPGTITSETTNRLKALLKAPLNNYKTAGALGRFVLVLDMNPGGLRAESKNFGACWDLAEHLLTLRNDVAGLETVAFVHGEVKFHSVLPVLACKNIAMSDSPETRLGPVVPPTEPLPPVHAAAYEQVLKKSGEKTANALRRMFKPADGSTIGYSFEQARPLDVCEQAPYNTLEEVLNAYRLPRAGTRRSLDRIVCWRIPVEGEVTRRLQGRVQRSVERALRARANVLVFEVSCFAGESQNAQELGAYLAHLNDKRGESPVETIAYVTREARNTAAFVALGCGKIVMQRPPPEANEDETEADRKGAHLGDFEDYLNKHPSLADLNKEREALARRPGAAPLKLIELELAHAQRVLELEKTIGKNLADAARDKGYPALLAEGLADRHDEIRYVPAKSAFLSSKDADERKADWDAGKTIKPAGKYLTLTARQAKEFGVATDLVKDFDELCEIEGIPRGDVRTPGSDWLEGLGDFLRNPWVSVLLVMVGITCLILELKMPGVGLPGVISAICFVLFFWSQSQLNGQIIWLAVLLFLLGLILIGLEVFVLPGFGVAGISGILLVLCGLGLAASREWPSSSADWVRLGQKIGPFGLSLLGALVSVAVIVRYLPHIPVLNRLMHRPDEAAEGAEEALDNPGHAELAALLGAIGVAATPLRPAGKTQFGDSFVDVVAEGGYIMPGARVQVVEVEGNRVVVKEV